VQAWQSGLSAWDAGITEAPKASLLEFQKIAYLLQGAGLPLGLRFEAGHYGPFSNGLNQAIAAFEGHQLLGFGDGTGGARADIGLQPGAAEEAEAAVNGDREFERAWAQLSHAFIGYEYPEGRPGGLEHAQEAALPCGGCFCGMVQTERDTLL
jgi:hypothetical protein